MRKLLLFSAGLVVLDQVTKLAVKGFDLFGIRYDGMNLYESHQIIGDFLRFTFVENPGMAFGLNFGMPVILSLFSVVASIFLIHLIRKTSTPGTTANTGFRIALAMILGGAVGNLIDRVFYGVFYGYGPLCYGKVVDFVDVDIPDLAFLGLNLDRFYIFNVADACVSVGVVLLLIFYPSKKPETQTQYEDVAKESDTSASALQSATDGISSHGSSTPAPEISSDPGIAPQNVTQTTPDVSSETRPQASAESPEDDSQASPSSNS